MYWNHRTVRRTKHPINGDGRVDTQDALYLLRYALRPEAYPLVENHDPVELPGKAATCTEPGPLGAGWLLSG